MNYFYQNRKNRTSISFPTRVSRGIIYPSIKDILQRARNGEDISQYLYESPFVGGTHRYMEFDEILNNNRMYMDRIRTLINSKDKDEVSKDDERSEKDEQTKSEISN